MRHRLFLLLLLPALLLPLSDTTARPRLLGHYKSIIHETDASLYQVKLFKGGGVYASGADGYFISSGDNGKNWASTQIKQGVALKTMAWATRKVAIVAGREDGKNLVWRSTDGAVTFDRTKVDTDLPIRDYAFFGRTHGFFVAGSAKKKDGTWRISKDGGRTFRKIDSVAYGNPARALLGICRAGEKGLFAVGGHVHIGYVGEAAKSLLYRKKQGAVLKSTDEGKSWVVLDAGNAADTLLYDVDFIDEKTGWVVGEKGFMAKTADGGKTWTKVTSGTKERLNAVQVIATETIYAVGENGTAIGTNDAGKTMIKFKTDTKYDLKDLSFLDMNTGFAVGTGGTVLRFVRDY